MQEIKDRKERLEERKEVRYNLALPFTVRRSALVAVVMYLQLEGHNLFQGAQYMKQNNLMILVTRTTHTFRRNHNIVVTSCVALTV